MKRTSVVGTLLLAVIASMMLLGAGTASAAKFTAGKVGAKLSTTILEQNEMSLTGSKIQCANASFSGTTEALESTFQKGVPLYTNCTAFGFAATVNTSGCVYKLTANGEVHIEGCTAGGFYIEVNSVFAKCKLFVKNQSVPNALTYSNTASTVDISVHVENAHGEVTESSGLCPVTKGTHTTVSTSVKVEAKAEGTTIQWDK